MGIQIDGGDGKRRSMGVTEDLRANVSSRVNERIYYHSRDTEDAFSVVASDALPSTAEYSMYFQNTNTEKDFVVKAFYTTSVSADVTWKLHKVTGTASGTDITPVNLNLQSGLSATAVCKGGAAGVTGLTSAAVIMNWGNGVAYDTQHVNMHDSLILGKKNAIAVEFDAGTSATSSISMIGYYD